MFNVRRLLAVFKARNKEFVRDRSAMAWSLAFPVLLIVAFAWVFSGDGKKELKWGVLHQQTLPTLLTNIKHTEFVYYQDVELAHKKISRHQIDLLVDVERKTYWLNETSAKGYLSEQVLLSAITDFTRMPVVGDAVRYIDWVIPGIIGMNLMFSCLFGVGYVIVRYRKSGVLKRLSVTPLNALEFILAQVFSRWLIVISISVVIFISSWFIVSFKIVGSLWLLALILFIASTAMIALGLLIAARSTSEELTGGLLNLASWPMMILSGVWFSLEGAPESIKLIAQIFPLTHFVDAARAILIDGAGLFDVAYNIVVLLGMTVCFLAAGAWTFNWGKGR